MSGPYVFHLDFYPRVHLITEHPPADRLWNGWSIPQPTARELVKYIKEWALGVEDDEYWEAMPNFFDYYANRVSGMDNPILDVDGFTWERTRMFVPDNGLDKSIAAGHQARLGHELVGYYEPIDNEYATHRLVRLCCPAPEPETSRWTAPPEGMEALADVAPLSLVEYLKKQRGETDG
jgi:hypothetical protein